MMINSESAKAMSTGELLHARRDISRVITIQEETERNYPGSCPKLGAYWDELYAVLGELKHREKMGHNTAVETREDFNSLVQEKLDGANVSFNPLASREDCGACEGVGSIHCCGEVD